MSMRISSVNSIEPIVLKSSRHAPRAVHARVCSSAIHLAGVFPQFLQFPPPTGELNPIFIKTLGVKTPSFKAGM